MPCFLLCHEHAPDECAVAFAAWSGHRSPLRHRPALSTCPSGGHRLWWRVEAASAAEARALLPDYVALRTRVEAVAQVPIP